MTALIHKRTVRRMWPWNRDGSTRDEVRTLREELAQIRSDFKRIRTEWEDMFEKLVRRDDRIRKRQEREETPEPVAQSRHELKAALRARLLGRGANGDS